MRSHPLRLPGCGFTDPSSRGPKLHLEWNGTSLFGNKRQWAIHNSGVQSDFNIKVAAVFCVMGGPRPKSSNREGSLFTCI